MPKEPLCKLEKGASELMWPPPLQMTSTALANLSSDLSPRPDTFVQYKNCTTRGKGTPEEKTYVNGSLWQCNKYYKRELRKVLHEDKLVLVKILFSIPQLMLSKPNE